MNDKSPQIDHLDEQTIELYVIQSEQVKDRQLEIGRHLAKCAGCAALHREIAGYYADVKKLQEAQAEKAAHALYSPDRSIRPRTYDSGVAAEKTQLSRRFAESVRRYPVRWASGVFALAVSLAFVVPQLIRHDTNPAYARAKNEFLIVSNKEGEELWRKHIGADFDASSGPRRITSHQEEATTTYDVDADGRNEVLAVFGWTSHYTQIPLHAAAICFNPDGTQRWRYDVHRTMVIGGVSYADDYRIYLMAVGDFDRDGRPEVILCASHNPWFPNVIIKLDARDGSFISEYWHPGVVNNFAHRDIDGDGVEELLFAGQNNRLGRACLLVLDPRRMQGYAPTPKEFIPQNVPNGSEKFYLLFPPTDLEPGWLDVTNRATELNIRADGLIEVVVLELVKDYQPEVYFYMDSTLTCVRVRGSDHFTAAHKLWEKEGKVSRELNDAFYENLQHRVLYWEGRRFVNKPTRVMKLEAIVKK
jgi:hypothetical protein